VTRPATAYLRARARWSERSRGARIRNSRLAPSDIPGRGVTSRNQNAANKPVICNLAIQLPLRSDPMSVRRLGDSGNAVPPRFTKNTLRAFRGPAYPAIPSPTA